MRKICRLAIVLLAILLLENLIFNVLVNVWEIESDPLPMRVEAIAPLSYGSYKNKLLRAQKEFIEETIRISDEHREAVIFSGAFTHSPDPNFEEFEKRRMIGEERWFVFVGNVASTITEAERMHEVMISRYGFEPATIVVVTGELHGRSAKFVWQKTFPHSQIYMRLIPWQHEIEENNTMLLARNKWTWLFAQIGRQAVIAWVPFDWGYNWFKKLNLRQPTQLTRAVRLIQRAP